VNTFSSIPRTEIHNYNYFGTTLDLDGNVYACHTSKSCILRFSANKDGSYAPYTVFCDWRSVGLMDSQRFKPMGITFDPKRELLYFTDIKSHCIWQVSLSAPSCVVKLAGVGKNGHKDEMANEARFSEPWSVALDRKSDNLYVLDKGSNTVRKIILNTGMVSTLYGNPFDFLSTRGLLSPSCLAISSRGDVLFVSDTGDHSIKAIDIETGRIWNVAGGTKGYQDGFGAKAQLNSPSALLCDRSNQLFFCDSQNFVVRVLEADHRTPKVSTVCGQPDTTFPTDGNRAVARLALPTGISIDLNGDLVVFDKGAFRAVKNTGARPYVWFAVTFSKKILHLARLCLTSTQLSLLRRSILLAIFTVISEGILSRSKLDWLYQFSQLRTNFIHQKNDKCSFAKTILRE